MVKYGEFIFHNSMEEYANVSGSDCFICTDKSKFDSNIRMGNDEDIKICGSCHWVKGPREWDLKFVYQSIQEGFLKLIHMVDCFRKQKYWCAREKCWTHLLDSGCSLWEPKPSLNRSLNPNHKESRSDTFTQLH